MTDRDSLHGAVTGGFSLCPHLQSTVGDGLCLLQTRFFSMGVSLSSVQVDAHVRRHQAAGGLSNLG